MSLYFIQIQKFSKAELRTSPFTFRIESLISNNENILGTTRFTNEVTSEQLLSSKRKKGDLVLIEKCKKRI